MNDLKNLTKVIKNSGVILCDDYDLTYAPGVKKAIDEYVLLNNFNLQILHSRFAEITKDSTSTWFNKKKYWNTTVKINLTVIT